MSIIFDKLKETAENLKNSARFQISNKAVPLAPIPINTDLKTRLLLGGLSSIGTAGMSVGVSKLLKRKLIVPGIAGGLAGFSGGFFLPDIHNNMIEYHKGNITKQQMKDIINTTSATNTNVLNKSLETIGSFRDSFQKQAMINPKPGLSLGRATYNVGKAGV